MRAFGRFILLVMVTPLALAHVGSPDVYFEGAAGPYRLLVTINPPAMVPGIAQVEVRVTSGTVAPPYNSLYPPGLLIGQVTSVNEESAYKSVNVHPIADLENLDIVQVLTAGAGSRPSNLDRLAASLPAGQSVSSGEASGEQLASTGGG